MFILANREPLGHLDQPKHVVVTLCSNHRLYEVCALKVHNFDKQICIAVGSYSPEVVVIVQI